MSVHLMNPSLQQALQLARSGYLVLPLFEPTGRGCSCGNLDCTRIGKHPRTAHGVHDATTDPEVITAWWSRYPEANIGLATGSKSGRFVLDVDGPEGRATLAGLAGSQPPAPEAAKILTGRGEHYFFRCDGIQVGNARLGPGLDLRGDGGYVVGPGSRHASGKRYRHAQWGRVRPARLLPDIPPNWLKALIAPRPLVQTIVSASTVDRTRAYADAALHDELDRLRHAVEGERNVTLNLCAFRLGQLVGAALLDANTVASAVLRVAQQIGLGESEAEATIRSGLSAGQRSPRTLELAAEAVTARVTELVLHDPLAEELAALGETDADNAQRLARRFGRDLVCTPGKQYLVYDGQRWQQDDGRRRFGFAEETARTIAGEVAHLPDPPEKARRAAFAKASLSKGALDRMLDVAQHRLMKEDRLFDADPFFLNTANGTLDLRTGGLRPHASTDLLTKLVPVTYDPHATCPTFEGFLERALKNDRPLVAYVQRAVGYTLTGAMGEQVFFFPYGPGGTGKSTLVNLVRDLLGDYGLHTPTETFVAKQYDNGATADLARLAGARMVTAVEVNWSRQIDEARVKMLTGGDPITARHLYHGFFTFQPTCKLWFVANDLPGVRGTAEAFWRRVHVIPFEVIIPKDERDDRLIEKLKAEAPGILAWAVRGCLAWQREGLNPPEAVRRGTEGWQEKADHLRRFCTEELILDAEHFVRAGELHDHYQRWCEVHGEKALDVRKFKAALLGRNLTHKEDRQGSRWQGVKLRPVH